MALPLTYSWAQGDSIWSVAARLMQRAGYADVSSLVRDIRSSNLGSGTANIIDWQAVPVGTIIVIPHMN